MSSIITKKKIANSFKKTMMKKPLQQISIREIMEGAHIRRQTFYDHFQDKYELTNWIYTQDFKEYIYDYINYDPFDKILIRFLNYLADNKSFYKNALSYHDQNAFEITLHTHLENLISDLMVKHSSLTSEELGACIHFMTYAIVGTITDWIQKDCQKDSLELVNELMIGVNKIVN